VNFKDLLVSDLRVNSENDRHGHVEGEEAAIEWLLVNRGEHMRNLAKDIVASAGVYEPPLVMKQDYSYLVFDGNRRVACLKLILDPSIAPDEDWKAFFDSFDEGEVSKISESLICQIEDDKERVDEILYRRHTGSQNGVGQSQWDAVAKSNFVGRTGKKSRIDLAEEVEKALRSESFIDDQQRIPRSNFNRLFSSEAFRNKIGITVRENRAHFTHERTAVLEALSKIVNDMWQKRVTLEDIWDNAGKNRYLDRLDSEGVTPESFDKLAAPIAFDGKASTDGSGSKGSSSQNQGARSRNNLIRRIDYGIMETVSNRRAIDIWRELQYKLKFGAHNNAISVLFRVLIEFSIQNYLDHCGEIEVHQNDSIASKYRKVLNKMIESGELDKKYVKEIMKFEKGDPIFATNTVNSYVHSPDSFPSDHHLKSMFDSLSKFFVICLNKH